MVSHDFAHCLLIGLFACMWTELRVRLRIGTFYMYKYSLFLLQAIFTLNGDYDDDDDGGRCLRPIYHVLYPRPEVFHTSRLLGLPLGTLRDVDTDSTCTSSSRTLSESI